MVLNRPPIQENTTSPSGKFPQVWIKWFVDIYNNINGYLFDSIVFNTSPSTQGSIPELYWNSDELTLDLTLDTNVTLQLGQETLLLGKNQTGATITNGTVVMFAGTLGSSGRIKIAPAVADGTYPSSYVIGIATEDIANGDDGFVTVFGKVRGLDTSSWSEGDILYADPSVNGGLTTTEPAAPNNNITMAAVVDSHAVNGVLFIRPTFEPKFTSLQDVNGTPVTTSGQIPVWDNANGYFDFTENIFDYAKIVSAPATASSTGIAGQIAYDSSYFYVCTATNTWKRTAISTW